MSSLIENLPDINFAEKDTALIEAEVISYFEEKIGRKLYAGDPLRILLLAFIKYLALQRSSIDFSGKQNLLRYAGEGYLQHLGALVGVAQLGQSSATTILRFTLSIALPNHTTIKKGTRATTGNKVYFATIEDADIPAGALTAAVRAVCTQPGIIGNGYYPGQVNQLSDPFPFNCTVENTTITQGGADIEDKESYRERIRLAPESYSAAGPYGAYIFWAKSASQLIADVSVTSPSPGVVEIIPLLERGEIPAQAILDSVYAECNDDTRRPLTDKVIVHAPEPVLYELSLIYYIRRRDSTLGLSIQRKVEEAVSQYILWQKTALGRDLNPSKLIETVMAAGVKRVEVNKPGYTGIQYNQIANAEKVNALYGGLEDD